MEMTLTAVKSAPVTAPAGFCFTGSMEGLSMRVARQRLNDHLLALAKKGTDDAAFDTLLDCYLLNKWQLAVADGGNLHPPADATSIGNGLYVQVDYREGREDPIIVRLYKGATH
ncbi:MAG: hypothetical protein EON60_08520 [Alphaproteobacteria bacterium]|nr:MAG: hypothetical protein EON60_08520 [Alphaproteobacteria bacterium]